MAPDQYQMPSHARSLRFIQPDGEEIALFYVYLISVHFQPKNVCILLTYTTHKITLKGYNLKELSERIILQGQIQISCMDERYVPAQDESASIVTAIEIMAKD